MSTSLISASIVKDLRSRTGAGIMDCKNALKKCDGKVDEAIDFLRKKGIAKAEKKAGRQVEQGIILSYIHPGNRIGVLIEVNCETDFVAKTDDFLNLVRNIAMQVAATNPLSLDRNSINKDLVEKEKNILFEQAKSSGKPDKILEKIVEGKVEKFFQENCLLEQLYIKDGNKEVQDIINQSIATLGENISIARFSRYEVRDSIDPDNSD